MAVDALLCFYPFDAEEWQERLLHKQMLRCGWRKDAHKPGFVAAFDDVASEQQLLAAIRSEVQHAARVVGIREWDCMCWLSPRMV